MIHRVSIIICTRNRAASLRQTLAAIDKVEIPAGFIMEVVVVDNGSRDETESLVRSTVLARMSLGYVLERRIGKCWALNTGMRQAQGDILLFTDDDVRSGPKWIEGICEPLIAGRADLVSGSVRLAPNVERPWLIKQHRARLAEVQNWPIFKYMVGANMAIHKRVLDRVPGFDPELGPGRLGAHEEALFRRQAEVAGYRVAGADERATVVHFCDVGRLSHEGFAHLARIDGASSAYIAYHWWHAAGKYRHLRLLKAAIGFCYLKMRSLCSFRTVDGMAECEYRLRLWISYFRQLAKERRRPRNYDKCGLVKLRGWLDVGCSHVPVVEERYSVQVNGDSGVEQ